MLDKYTKEDLLWEAVRRNQYYREYYQKVCARISTSSHPREIPKYHGIEDFPLDPRFKIRKVFNPDIDIDEIKRRIKDGESGDDIHPYSHLTEKSNDQCIFYHPFPGDRIFRKTKTSQPQYDFIQHETENDLLIIPRSILFGRVVISIDPLAPEEIILSGIRKMRDAAQIACKAHLDEMVEQLNKAHAINNENSKEENESEAEEESESEAEEESESEAGEENESEAEEESESEAEEENESEAEEENESEEMRFVCHPLKVDAYIAYLRKYDEVIDYCKKHKIPLKLRRGVLEMKDSAFNYKVMLTESESKSRLASMTKKWREATRRAFYLIKCAPNIPFAPYRTEKHQLEKDDLQ